MRLTIIHAKNNVDTSYCDFQGESHHCAEPSNKRRFYMVPGISAVLRDSAVTKVRCLLIIISV